MKIFLASESPRRRELLSQIGLKFEVCAAPCNEIMDNSVTIKTLVTENASRKACAALNKITGNTPVEPFVIIAADTVVCLDGEIFGKPENDAHASNMLKKLSGRRHEVHTGVCVIYYNNFSKKILFSDKTHVYMKKLSDDDISAYVKSGEPADKAGAYAIQGLGAIFIEKISGDYNTVVGLPVSKIYHIFKKLGLANQVL